MDEQARLELARDWLTRGSRDLAAARALAALSEPLLDSAIYHCQQAAEKSLKGWLQTQDDPFPKTHDLEQLMRQAALLEPEFDQHLQAAVVLTPYASAFCYPGGAFEPMPSREEFDEALGHAQVIYDFVVARLPAEAKP
jgi:HEPN domain-containing protein